MGEIKGHRSLCPRSSDTVAKNVSYVSHSDSSSGTTEKDHISQLPLQPSWGHVTCSGQRNMSRREEHHHFWFEPVKSQCAFSISLLQGDLGAHWSRMVIHKLQCAYESPGSLIKCRSCCGAGRGGSEIHFKQATEWCCVSEHTFE